MDIYGCKVQQILSTRKTLNCIFVELKTNMKSILPFYLGAIFILTLGCKEKKKYHDDKEKSQIASTEALQEILDYHEAKNSEFKNPKTSPLADKDRIDFESLVFFEPDTSYVVKAVLVRTPDAKPFQMPTTTGENSTEVVYGILHFELHGKKLQLEVYQNKELMLEEGYEDYLFLPFTDETNGEETYGGGRYIDLKIPSSEVMIIDFNRAYNPYCAYNKKYSCPIVPKVNHLSTKVRAGVKAFD